MRFFWFCTVVEGSSFVGKLRTVENEVNVSIFISSTKWTCWFICQFETEQMFSERAVPHNCIDGL